MNAHIVVDRFTRSAIAGVLACCLVPTAVAVPGQFTHSVTIAVLADRYIAGGVAFDDLDRLEKRVTAAHVQRVELILCGANSTRAFKAAVHRFRNVPVQMRLPNVDKFDCVSKAPVMTPVRQRVRQRVGQRPFGIDDQAVERYWLDMVP